MNGLAIEPDGRSRRRILGVGLLAIGPSAIAAGLPFLVAFERDDQPDLAAAPGTFGTFAAVGVATMVVAAGLLVASGTFTPMQRRMLVAGPVLGTLGGFVVGMFVRFVPGPAMWIVSGSIYALLIWLCFHASGGPARAATEALTGPRQRFNLVLWFLDLPRSTKLAAAWVGLVVVEVGVMLGGFLMKPSVVRCGGDRMDPGDVCEIYREPGHVFVGTKDYDEMRDEIVTGNLVVGWIALIAVVITVGVGIAFAVRALRASGRPQRGRPLVA